MVIGQFVDTYPPCVDGVGRVTQSYCETLTAMGHQAWYIAPDAPGTAGNYDFPVLLQKSIAIPGEPFRLAIPAVDFSYRKRLERDSLRYCSRAKPLFRGRGSPAALRGNAAFRW